MTCFIIMYSFVHIFRSWYSKRDIYNAAPVTDFELLKYTLLILMSYFYSDLHLL